MTQGHSNVILSSCHSTELNRYTSNNLALIDSTSWSRYENSDFQALFWR